MSITRRRLLASAAAASAMPLGATAQTSASVAFDVPSALRALQGRDTQSFFDTLVAIKERGGLDLVSSLIFSLRFSWAPDGLIHETLQQLTGESHEDWHDWMLWQEGRPDIASHPAFIDHKIDVLLGLDPTWDVFLSPKYMQPEAMTIRFEEIAWGGVRKDGIPSLDNPPMIAASEAGYLLDDDLVFGVSINGDTRAYPLRIMGWHEMFNDVIGGVPVALAYCTLCGAGILFETQVNGRADPFIFGSSGFLYRSNKLMFDRETNSLWNQFTGKPVSGPLVDEGIELVQRPVVITEWKNWRETNPNSSVLSLRTGFLRDYGSGVVYNDYFASDQLMFPALVDQSERKQKSYVFGMHAPGASKAWPLDAFEGGRVINDRIGFQNVVLIGDAARREVRAYDRGDLEFAADLTADGVQWTLREDALAAPDGRRAPRMAGHIAYWFAWDNYLGASSEVYEG